VTHKGVGVIKECSKCGNKQLLVEDLGEGRQRIKCSQCGLQEIRDAQGRKLLLNEWTPDNILLS